MSFKTKLHILVSIFLTWGLLWSPLASAQNLKYLPPALASLMRHEQTVNRNVDPVKIASLNNQQSQKYAPEGQQWFEVKSYWVPADSVDFLHAKTSLLPDFQRQSQGLNEVLFIVHPESESFYVHFLKQSKPGPVFKALATSSSRTLLVHPASDPSKLFFAKLSLNKEVGSVVRTIPKGEVARSIGTTIALQAMQAELPENFKFFPETIGVMPKGMERGGLIIREIPREIMKNQVSLMPMFSFFTPPSPTSMSPVIEMVESRGIESVNELVLRPFAKLWAQVVVRNGIAIEAHAQNFLIATRSGLPLTDYYFRDFGGFNIDLEAFSRRYPEIKLPVLTDLQTDYHQKFHQEAIRQSLTNYYEGGVLYGLGLETEVVSRKLNYANLKSQLRQELSTELAKFDVVWNKSDSNYNQLANSIAIGKTHLQKHEGSFCKRALNFLGF